MLTHNVLIYTIFMFVLKIHSAQLHVVSCDNDFYHRHCNSHTLIQIQYKELYYCFGFVPLGHKQRPYNLVEFCVSTVHYEGMLEVQSPLLRLMLRPHLSLWPHISSLDLVGTEDVLCV